MIGGKEVFLPHHLVEAKNCVFDATTAEGQPIVTVREKEELEQTSKSAPAKEEHSAEMLKIFSQEAEQDITIALEVVVEEEHADKMLTPWEMELEMIEDWLNHPKLVYEFHKETVMQMIEEEHSEESLRIFSQGTEQMITTVSRHAIEDEGEF